jgi:hypothetical protein
MKKKVTGPSRPTKATADHNKLPGYVRGYVPVNSLRLKRKPPLRDEYPPTYTDFFPTRSNKDAPNEPIVEIATLNMIFPAGWDQNNADEFREKHNLHPRPGSKATWRRT